MKRILLLCFSISVLIIISFLLFSDVEKRITQWTGTKPNTSTYILLSYLLLACDIVLPIPSSLLMILNGKMMGLAAGSFLSILSTMTSSLIGFHLGRKGNKFINRFFTPKDIIAGNQFFERFGAISVAVSKFIPILSESISVVSGCSNMTLKQYLLFSVIGNSLVSLTYGLIGAYTIELNSNLLAGIVILAILLITWIIGNWAKKKTVGQ